jgi:transcriptional regulator with XRE-family HTH domain
MPRKSRIAKPGEPLYYRQKAGFTLEEVENLSGIRSPTVSKLENGQMINPSANTLWLLASLYANKLKVKPDGIALAMLKHYIKLQKVKGIFIDGDVE